MDKRPTLKPRRQPSRRVAALLLCVGIGLLIGLYSAHRMGWLEGEASSGAVVYDISEKPDSQLYTGSGSAQFSIYAPQYPGSIIVEAARYEDALGGTMMAVMTTPDDPVEVAEFYRRELASKAFRPRIQAKSMPGGGERTLISGGRPSAGLDVMVSITKGADGLTRIELADNATLTDSAPR